MIIEAFDSKQTKFKIGMEFKVKDVKGSYYIVSMELDKEDNLNIIRGVKSDFTEWYVTKFKGSNDDITLTGNYEPDFLKLRRKLAK